MIVTRYQAVRVKDCEGERAATLSTQAFKFLPR